jgi:uncharacterized protein YaeQ
MASKESPMSGEPAARRIEEAAELQEDLLKMYQEASRAWLERAQSEAALWSNLAATLVATRSIPEAVEAYTKCVSRQMQMSAEDGQHLIQDCQQFTQKITRSFSTGWPAGGGT